jgi:NADPH:quinone reductase-like Zn-dependent oxidoreductase
MRSLSADRIIDYKHPDAVEQVVQKVQKSGLSLILDCIEAKTRENSATNVSLHPRAEHTSGIFLTHR